MQIKRLSKENIFGGKTMTTEINLKIWCIQGRFKLSHSFTNILTLYINFWKYFGITNGFELE